jgi:hypothetical protein
MLPVLVFLTALNPLALVAASGHSSRGSDPAPSWQWSSEFAPNFGCDGEVYSLARMSDGRLFLGGEFTVCGTIAASNVVIFDPNDGSFLPIVRDGINGVSGRVWAVERAGPDIYVGGFFTFAGGLQVNNIARFDGVQWHSLTIGVSSGLVGGEVRTLAYDDGQLYAGGFFISGGGTPLNRIGRWDGTSWDDLGGGVTGAGLVTVDRLAIDPTQSSTIVATGNFSEAGGTLVNKIARLDGSQWGALSDSGGNVGLAFAGDALLVSGSEIIVGGTFDDGTGVFRPGVQRFTGSEWLPVGSNQPSGPVNALGVFNGDLVAGGSFSLVGSDSARGLARLDGSEWVALIDQAVGVEGRVQDLLSVGGNLVIAGRFSDAGGRPVSAVTRWDGTRFWSLSDVDGLGPNNEIRSMARYQGDLIIAGEFEQAGGIEVRRIARLSGPAWEPLGNGFSQAPRALLSVGSDLYAGGNFNQAGFTSAQGVARWDGTDWHALGDGLGGTVTSLVWHEGELHAAGFFTSSGATTLNRVARFDGLDWQPLGDGVDRPVDAMTSFQGDLIVAGSFDTAGGVAVDGMARWDGSSWSAFGGEIAGEVEALLVHDGNLYAGGAFASIDGVSIENVARYDGQNWSAVGLTPPEGLVTALAASGSWLIAAGDFARSDFTTSGNLAAFDGQNWQLVGDGIGHGGDWTINALLFDGQPLQSGLPPPFFIGGLFGQAGPHAAANLSRIEARSSRIFSDRFELINEN